jgi:hypothetical protein
MIRMLSSWRHSGFHVFCGNRISPDDEQIYGARPTDTWLKYCGTAGKPGDKRGNPSLSGKD